MPDKNKEKKNHKDKISQLEEELLQQRQVAEDYLQQLKRLKAEFENYRKRMLRESGEKFKSGEKTLAKGLLYVLDNMERALEGDEVDREGINLIKKEFFNILRTRGLKKMKVMGEKFDPNYHHALSFVEDSEKKPGCISEVVQPGYLWDGEVLRPAQVVVAKKEEENENIDIEKGGKEK